MGNRDPRAQPGFEERQRRRLEQAAAEAKRAEEMGDNATAMAAWERYKLIEDTLSSPGELLSRVFTSTGFARRATAGR